jgi:hypothetical protein
MDKKKNPLSLFEITVLLLKFIYESLIRGENRFLFSILSLYIKCYKIDNLFLVAARTFQLDTITNHQHQQSAYRIYIFRQKESVTVQMQNT